MEVVHSRNISSFMEKKAQHACHKKIIFIGATSGGLITLRGVLVVNSYFYFMLRAIFNPSCELNFCFQKANFCISLPISVISF